MVKPKARVVTAKPRRSKAQSAGNKKQSDLPEPRKLQWYEYATPLLGIKWGATIVVVGSALVNHHDSKGMVVASLIVIAFLALEWTTAAWREFRRV